MKWNKSTVLTVGFLLAVGVITFTLIASGNKYECKVCIRYNNTDSCQLVRGADKHETIMQGVSTACGGAARGMTESIQCQATPPTQAECREL